MGRNTASSAEQFVGSATTWPGVGAPRWMPRDPTLDATVALVREGYDYISNRCRLLGTDVFRTRLLLQPTVCMRGPAAASVFYDETRFVRAGASPRRIVATLFGKGGVQGLDDEPHRHRKRMLMSLMGPDDVRRLADVAERQWDAAMSRWENADEIVLLDEVQLLLCRTACAWADVPLPDAQAGRRTSDLAAMIEGAGAFGPSHWRARLARRRSEAWLVGLIEGVRRKQRHAAEGSALAVVAEHRDLDGELLDPRVAAVELLNLLRPTVSVAWLIALCAHALHQHPIWHERLSHGASGDAELFAHEVRRFYPFFPFVAARVRHDFEWSGFRFAKGTLVLLDLYGTNHDTTTWDDPGQFRPERFYDWSGSAYDFIPQGGGDHFQHHRCAGEWMTIELMRVGIDALTRAIVYDIPPQDLEVSRSQMPAQPASRMRIRAVQRVRPPR